MKAPTRWAYRQGTPEPEIEPMEREALRVALDAMRLRGDGAICRDLATGNEERWHPQAGSSGNPDRALSALTTGQVMFMVAEGYARVSNAAGYCDPSDGSWSSRPVRIYTTGKGLERR
jgi:hypothetical protein